MALAHPEDLDALEDVSTEFLNLCETKNLKVLTIIQASIAVGAAAILSEADGDRTYAKQLLERYIGSMTSAILPG